MLDWETAETTTVGRPTRKRISDEDYQVIKDILANTGRKVKDLYQFLGYSNNKDWQNRRRNIGFEVHEFEQITEFLAR